MRYTNNGIEVQYRECQILRDAAKLLLEKDFAKGTLLKCKDAWIKNIKEISETYAQKQKHGKILANTLQDMDIKNFAAVSEYVEFLVIKDKGIDIMCPFIATSRVVILPVNKHMPIDTEYSEEQGD